MGTPNTKGQRMIKVKLNLENPVVIYPQLARALGGIKEALLFQQLYYWSDKGSREDGFIYKTKEEIEKETALSIKEQDRARANLIKLEVIETMLKKANGVPTLHYKVHPDKVNEILDLTKGENGILPKGRMESDQKVESITETTTETTTTSNTNVLLERSALLKPLPKQEFGNKDVNEVLNRFEQRVGLVLTRKAMNRNAAQRLIKVIGLDGVLKAIDIYSAVAADQFAPQISSIEELEEKWTKLGNYIKKKHAEQTKTAPTADLDNL